MSQSPSLSVAAKQQRAESPTRDSEGLFPLPLAPIEKYLVLDDRPECPMTSFIELHFAGPLQVNALANALHQTVHHHPLLASTLIEIDGHLHWQYDPNFVPELRDPATDPILLKSDLIDSDQPNPRPIDLYREPGCRYWYSENDETGRSRLIIQLHHAACDGVGLRRVLIDTLGSYAKTTDAVDHATGEAESDETPRQIKKRKRDQLDPTRLLDRADFSEIQSKPLKKSLTGLQKLANAYYFHFQRPQPLVADKATDKATDNSKHTDKDSDDQPLRHFIFDEPMSKRLLDCCRQNEISVNDLMLTILFRVCQHWNRAQGITKPNSRIRLLMPVDLRGRTDLQTPATNRLSFSFLGRTHKQCDDWQSLLASVQAETQDIKDTRVYMDFLEGLAALAGKPKSLARAIRFSRNMSTSVLTYTGDIARGMKSHFPEQDGRRKVGDSFLDNILIAPPARQHTNITLGICINWGQICISANWNRNELTGQQCQQFLQLYADATAEWLATMELEQ
ncbi:acyltransferase PapA5 [Rubripirellula obstinata]|uniref:Acyltransferase PapA5 n=1 Tax=Rubripirellula obstinata TaxID=406547 RepID=A0A5B1CBK3_9BACT|nr:hypothetical protein [Rubripirellula obstinata]KAA1257611.1 acyltransferase PapA5 [Rubripirellula obstinata]